MVDVSGRVQREIATGLVVGMTASEICMKATYYYKGGPQSGQVMRVTPIPKLLE
jgi:hypothetical protein